MSYETHFTTKIPFISKQIVFISEHVLPQRRQPYKRVSRAFVGRWMKDVPIIHSRNSILLDAVLWSAGNWKNMIWIIQYIDITRRVQIQALN